MKMRATREFGFFAAGVLLCGAVLLTWRARAAGIPDADVLTYTGYLEDGEGSPLTGDHSIEVQFLDAVDATSDLCTGSLASVELQSGRFQVPLPVDCVDAVKGNPNIWVDVKVDGARLGPTKLGAVPFALEAGHAVKADHADRAAEADAASSLVRKSAFRATANAAQTVTLSSVNTVLFGSESLDVGNEFNPTTSQFVPKVAGLYALHCTTYSNSGSIVYEVMLRRDGGIISVASGTGNGLQVNDLIELDVGDVVTCGVFTTTQGLAIEGNGRTNFSAVRME